LFKYIYIYIFWLIEPKISSNLIFIYSCILIKLQITANKIQLFLILFIFTEALHVSGGSSAHHQEHITVHTASGIVKSILLLAAIVEGISTVAANSQQDATFLDFIYFYRRSTCFRRFLRPSSGAHNCTYSVRYCQTNTAVSCYRGGDLYGSS